MGEVNAGELIILGRQLTRIGTAALRDAQLPGGAIPTGISLIGADVLAYPATSVSEIAQRTGLRQGYVSESVAELRDRGVVETEPDAGDEGRTRVRLAADAHPERATAAALADVTPALRGALGPGAGPGTVTTALASLDELARQLGSRAAGSEAAPDQPAGDAGDEEETEETLVTRAVPTRSAGTGAEDGPDAGEPDVTRVDSTRADRTRADLSRTRVDATRADRTRADLPRPASSGGIGVGNTANARRAVRAKTDPAAVRARSGRKRQSRLSRIARYLTGDE